MPNTTDAQLASDVALVRSLARSGETIGTIIDGLYGAGRTEDQVRIVIETWVAEPTDSPADEHAEYDRYHAQDPGTPGPGALPTDAVAATEQLAVWTLTRMDPCRNVQEGDYHEMYVVAQSPEAARSWAYRRAVLDNKPNPKVWIEADEFELRVLHFYDVDADEQTGVQLAETWTAEKMARVPFRLR